MNRKWGSGSGDAALLKLWFLANRGSVFFPKVLVDVHRYVADTQAVRAVSTRARNPIRVASIDFVIVRFESAPFQALKFFLTVAKGASPLVLKDTSNPGWTDQSLGFRFDIHDPRSFSHCCTVPRILPNRDLTC